MEVVEGRATGGRGSDTEPNSHVDPIGGCASGEADFYRSLARCLTQGRSPVR
jgi:hypothetical protein